jgi:hypothetical protein
MAFWKESDEVLLDASKVDIVATAADGSRVQLVITHSEQWTGSDAQVHSLQEKVNTYVGFALDGPMVEAYPSTAGMRWEIMIVSKKEMDARTSDVVARLGEAVRRYGGDVHFRIGP